MGDPPITSPTDPSSVPVLVTEWTTPAYHALQMGALQDTKRQIRQYRKLAWHWQTVVGQKRKRFSSLALHTQSIAYARQVLGKTKVLSRRLHAKAKRYMVQQTKSYHQQAGIYRQLLGIAVSQRSLQASGNIELQFVTARRQAEDLAETWGSSSLLRAFTCIHHYEGSWDANTGNGYYGGLQMDRRFQSSYGSDFVSKWGTADNWPVWAQVLASVRAYRSGRGFYPWPNTARACGLI